MFTRSAERWYGMPSVQQLVSSKDLSNNVPIPQNLLSCDLAPSHALELGQACFCFNLQNMEKVTCMSQNVMQLPLGSWGVYPGRWQSLHGTSHFHAGDPHGGAGWQSQLFPCHQLYERVLFCSQDQPCFQLSSCIISASQRSKSKPSVSSEIPEP
jgi:hypothetical protein